jgi:hypothetical protein
MNNQNNLLAQYEQAINQHSLPQFFSDLCNCPFEGVFAFIKKSDEAKILDSNGNPKLNNKGKPIKRNYYCYLQIGADSFWTSKLPTHFFDDLLSSDNFLLEDVLLITPINNQFIIYPNHLITSKI